MAYIIAEPCIDVKDKACVEVCPVDCIHPTDGEGEPMLFIDPDECIDCGVCEPECPVEAIIPDTGGGDDEAKWLEINTKFSEIWPNITRKGEPPANADNFKDETGKFDKYFSEKPGEGT